MCGYACSTISLSLISQFGVTALNSILKSGSTVQHRIEEPRQLYGKKEVGSSFTILSVPLLLSKKNVFSLNLGNKLLPLKMPTCHRQLVLISQKCRMQKLPPITGQYIKAKGDTKRRVMALQVLLYSSN